MASRLPAGPLSAGRLDECRLVARIRGNGAAHPIEVDGIGAGILSVTRTAAGRLTIALEEPWARCLGVLCTYQDTAFGASPSRRTITVITTDVTEAKAITLAVEDATSEGFVATDLASTQYLTVEILLKNGRTTP